MRGFEDEKSEIHDIGTELNALTTLAPGARSATISLEVRPEMMWGTRLDGRYVVTGLSPRGHALFGRSYEDAVSHPLFLHHYRDPLWREPGFAFDDRSLTFSLAVMVAEWTMGVYPLLQTWGHETAEHMRIEAPPALGLLLESGLSPTLAARPALAAFVAELAQLAARL